MQFLRIFLLLVIVACVLRAQDPPVIDPRGVLNAFTKTAALASVARGGILEIDGQNLGPDAGVTASGLPLPTKLGNPPIQVLIQGKAVPLFSATPNRILVQIPWNATVGAAQAVVDRGGIQSTAVNFTIAAAVPAIQTANGSGYGVAGSLDGQTLSLSASGLGPTNKTVNAGAVGTDNPPIVPTAALAAYVGGIGANVTAKLSTQRVGEFDVQIDVPAGARAGDLIALSANGTFANFGVFQGLAAPDVQFIPLPSGTPQLVTLTNADLNGNYLIAVANSDARGCYQAFLFDVVNKNISVQTPCPGSGFVQLDLASQGLTFIPLPSSGEFDVTAGANGNVNSYVYGLNADTLNGAASDSLFVLDGADGSAFRLGAPAGITSFQGLQQVASMNLLVGLATKRNAGDAGLVVFDLQNQAMRLLPIPSGFASVTIAGIFATTRKVVARAAKPGNDGAQLLIYDLASGAVTIVPNPPGVTLYGQAGAAATAPQILIANVKANTVAAIGMDQNARQPRLLVVRIP